MWSDLFRRHCSDETLLAHVDGELPVTRTGVNRHLRSCWRCRARLAELEEQTRALATAFEGQAFPGPYRIAEAQHRFWDRVEQYERSLAPAPEFRLMPSVHRYHWWAAVACAMLLGAPLLVHVGRDPVPKPTEVLAAMRSMELELPQPSLLLHQELRVEIRQTRPARSQRTSHLRVWNDAAGAVRYAAWRTQERPEWVYSPAVQVRYEGGKVQSLAFLGKHGREPRELEELFFGWLQSRKKALVSFASDFQAFSLENGVLVGVRKIVAQNGSELFRLWARRDISDGQMEMIVDVDAGTYRPRIQLVRFKSATREVELRLISERIEMVYSAPEPPREQLQARIRPATVRPNRETVVPKQPEAEPALSRDELDRAELEVLYTLHRARACLGEPIEVEQRSDGKIRVQGLVATEARRAEIAFALGALNTPQLITVDLRTAEEAAVVYETEQSAESTRVEPSPLPIQNALERYFERRHQAGQAITELANAAVTLSKNISDEAWALRRLAERFGGGGMDGLRLESKWLLEVMLRDHAASLTDYVKRSRTLLEPALSVAAAGTKFSPVEREQDGDIWSAVLSLFSLAERTDALVQGLFAGDSLPLEQDQSAAGAMRLMAGDEAAARLANVLSDLTERLDQLESLVAQEFPGRPLTQSAK